MRLVLWSLVIAVLALTTWWVLPPSSPSGAPSGPCTTETSNASEPANPSDRGIQSQVGPEETRQPVREVAQRVLRFSVRTLSGEPIEGAAIFTFGEGDAGGPSATSDGKGLAECHVDRSLQSFEVRAEGYCTYRSTEISLDTVNVVLRRSVELRGRVVRQEDDQPIQRALVSVRETRAAAAGEDRRQASTDEAGEFSFADMPEGDEFLLVVRASGFLRCERALTIDGDAKQRLETIALRSGQPVTGRVISLPSGNPIVGARVYEKGHSTVLGVSGTDGVFEAGLPRPEESRRTIFVEADDHCRIYCPLDGAGPIDLTSPPIALPESCTIEGSVRDAAGDPITGIQVGTLNQTFTRVEDLQARGMHWASGMSPAWSVSRGGPSALVVRTDSNGRYTIGGIVPGVRDWVTVSHGSYQSPVPIGLFFSSPGETREADFSLEPGGEVRGKVFVNGVAAPHATVRWVGEKNGRPVAGSAQADGTGSYVLKGIRPGRVEFLAHTRNFPPGSAEGARETLQVVLDRPALLDFHLRAELRVVRGVVLGPEGDPSKGTTVSMHSEFTVRHEDTVHDLITRSGKTDERGEFAFEVPPMGTYMVMASQDSIVVKRGAVLPGDENVVLRLLRTGVVAGRIFDSSTGEAVPLVAVSWRYPGSRYEHLFSTIIESDVTIDQDGRFEAPAPVGVVDLRCKAEGYFAGEALGCSIGPRRAATEIEIPMERRCRLELWTAVTAESLPRMVLVVRDDVYLSHGRRVEDLLVATDIPSDRMRRAQLDPSSRTVLEDLRPGIYHVLDIAEQPLLRHETVTLPSQAELELTR